MQGTVNPFGDRVGGFRFFPSLGHRQVVHRVTRGLESGCGLILVTGEIGIGKTSVCRHLQREFGEAFAFAELGNPFLTPAEMLWHFCREFNVPLEGLATQKDCLDALAGEFRRRTEDGRPPVLLLDECHLLTKAHFGTLLVLSNLRSDGGPLVRIVLIGQVEIMERLREEGLEALNQRIGVRCELSPLSGGEVGEYVSFRLRQAGIEPEDLFDRAALKALARVTGGLPRLINHACAHAFDQLAFTGRDRVTAAMIEDVAGDAMYEGLFTVRTKQRRSRTPWLAAAALACITLLLFWPGSRDGLRRDVSDVFSGLPSDGLSDIHVAPLPSLPADDGTARSVSPEDRRGIDSPLGTADRSDADDFQADSSQPAVSYGSRTAFGRLGRGVPGTAPEYPGPNTVSDIVAVTVPPDRVEFGEPHRPVDGVTPPFRATGAAGVGTPEAVQDSAPTASQEPVERLAGGDAAAGSSGPSADVEGSPVRGGKTADGSAPEEGARGTSEPALSAEGDLGNARNVDKEIYALPKGRSEEDALPPGPSETAAHESRDSETGVSGQGRKSTGKPASQGLPTDSAESGGSSEAAAAPGGKAPEKRTAEKSEKSQPQAAAHPAVSADSGGTQKPVPDRSAPSPVIEMPVRDGRAHPVVSAVSIDAVAWDDDPAARVAVLNETVLREGGRLGRLVLERIERDSLVFRYDGELWTLPWNG